MGLTAFLIWYFVCANNYVRPELNKANGFINDNLSRRVIEQRDDFDDIVFKEQKLFYYNEVALNWSTCESDQYWNE